MQRRSMDRKLRSSLQKNQASLTTPAALKPAKNMRSSALNNGTGNHSRDVTNSAQPTGSNNLLPAEVMQPVYVAQCEKSNERDAEAVESDDLPQSEKSNKRGAEAMESDDLLQKSSEREAEAIQMDSSSASTCSSNSIQSESDNSAA